MTEPPPPVGLVATDLDGTLLGPDHSLGPRDAAALRQLGRAGVVRVVATGRSLRAAERVLDPGFPIDYLVVSSGAGVLEWRSRRLLRQHRFEGGQGERVTRVLHGLGVDFMAHSPVPDDHRFRYFRARGANPDFERRVGRYDEFATRWEVSKGGGIAPSGAACQFVAIVGGDEAHIVDRTRAALPGFEVVRATSPLDGHSIWVEVRPPGVGKARAVAWLAARHRLDAARTAAVGNDYNDSEMLAWSANAFVVGNAPADLRERFRVVSPNDAGGFGEVVEALRRDAGGFARAAAQAGT